MAEKVARSNAENHQLLPFGWTVSLDSFKSTGDLFGKEESSFSP